MQKSVRINESLFLSAVRLRIDTLRTLLAIILTFNRWKSKSEWHDENKIQEKENQSCQKFQELKYEN